MLKVSTFIAAMGVAIQYIIQLYLVFGPNVVVESGSIFHNIINFVYIGFLTCLIQFFIVFFIKLSTTRK